MRKMHSVTHGAIGRREIPGVWGLNHSIRVFRRQRLRDSKLAQLLVLVDALRDGRARERKIAARDLVHGLRGRVPAVYSALAGS
jgi:hypothetical protein